MKRIIVEGKERKNQTKIELKISTSTELSLEDKSVDAVITSPPYCTRIDYAVATSIELALIGIAKDETFEQLRSNMIGTTKIVSKNDMIDLDWGETAVSFLYEVKNHSSKASQSYYLKQYIQYLDSISKSVEEFYRVLKQNGSAIIVVQDSYYKDVHLDLAAVFIDICRSKGLKLQHREYFKKSQTLAGINKNTIKYRNKADAIEHVLVFKKGD
jgi:DNA modification methylase